MTPLSQNMERGNINSFPLQFRGTVKRGGDPAGPLRLTLTGITEQGEELQIAFATRSPPDIPPSLENGVVDRSADRRYRISAAGREWLVDGVAHLHRSVTAAFNRALPARAVPWRKRAFWQVLLAFAALISRMQGSRDPRASRVAERRPDSDTH